MKLNRRLAKQSAFSCLAAVLCMALPAPSFAQQDAGFDPSSIVRVMELKEKAESLALEGKSVEAATAAEEVLTALKEIYGSDNLDVADWRGTLGNLYLAADEPGKALAVFEEVRAYFEAQEMLTDTGYTESLSSIARCHLALADYEKAAELQKNCLATIEGSESPKPEFIALHAARLGMIYWEMGARAEALPEYEKSLEQYQAIHGDYHHQTAVSKSNLGTLYMELSEYDQALPLLEDALSVALSTMGPAHPHTILILNNLAELYEKRDEVDLALSMLKRSLSATEGTFGLESIETASVLNNLGRVENKLQHPDKAAAHFGQAYDLLQARLIAGQGDDPKVLGLLGTCYQGLGQPDEAEMYFKQSLAAFEEQRGEQHPYTREAREQLADFYEYLGRFDEAKALR
jgi:tetratricopeptide (TPR) repeat protein